MNKNISEMDTTWGAQAAVLVLVAVSTVLFSVFRMGHLFFPFVNMMAEAGASLLTIILTTVFVQMILAGFVVLVILPRVLHLGRWREWLSAYLWVDLKGILAGLLSFVVFCVLAAILSRDMGIYKGDLATVFAYPDIRPDPDVIGWGYFILALVPGIWEELAFRGLVQTKLRKVFTTPVAIFFSSTFFALFHFSLLLTHGPGQAAVKVVMAFFFGLGWGYLTVQARSVVPGMLAHYLVDALGQIFLQVESADPALTTVYFVLLTLLFPLFTIILVKIIYRQQKPRLYPVGA